MSTLATVSAGKVRQRLYNGSNTLGGSNTRSALIFYTLKALFLHLAANKGNPDLELKYVADGGNSAVVGGACTVYGIFIKKGTVATTSFFKVSNHATVVQASAEVILASSVAGEEIAVVYPNGLALGTGLAAGSYTAYSGTDTTTASTATHNFYGYVIVGA